MRSSPWVILSAAHISDTRQAPSLKDAGSNFAFFADSPAAACWRRRRSFPCLSLRRSSAIWNRFSPRGASTFLAQSDELPRSHSSPRATSAYVVPDFLCSSTAFCLNSGVYLGEGGGFHSCLQSSVARIMRNGNQLVNGNRADSDL